MATNQDTTTAPPECAADFCERLRSAGVNQTLISEMFDRIDSERSKAIAKAARIFYRCDDRQSPISLVDFADELNNMTRRLCGLASAIEGVMSIRRDAEAGGLRQLANDLAREMERLAEAFDAERWLARNQEAQS